MDSTFQLNLPDVSAEAFDGEIIAINLKSGHYHSLRGTAFHAWTLLMQGCSVGQAGAALGQLFPEAADAIAGDMREFVAELQAAELLVPASAPAGPAPAAIDLPAPAGPYEKPVVESFTDMQELLLLDPVHEVDLLMGWPRKPEQDADGGDPAVAAGAARPQSEDKG